jgi:circadian clock protein KaiC
VTANRQCDSERLSTGVSGLDTVLCGGLIPGSVFIIQGAPGAGKTILANQICFHRAAQGQNALYVTLLAESHDRLIGHLRKLAFYDDSRIPQSMYYISGFDILAREGLKGVLQLLRQETRAHKANMVVLDGLFALEEAVGSESEFRKFINELSSLANLLGCTVLLLTNSSRPRSSAEYTMVDGWLELDIEEFEYRDYRFFRVHKYRGSDFISGRHAMTISGQGIRVLPRLEALRSINTRSHRSQDIQSTGIAELDAMIGGGLPGASATLLAGPTGIGKTTMGLHFISQCSAEEPGLIFGFYEQEEGLRFKAAALGMDLDGLVASGAVTMLWQSATENLLDELGERLLSAVRQYRPRRLFIDGIDGFRQSVVFSSRISSFITGLNNVLRSEGVTTLFTSEIPELIGGEAKVTFGSITAVAQNVVLLRYFEQDSELHRTLVVVKVRESPFDPAVRLFKITNEGIKIGARLRRGGVLPQDPGEVELPSDRSPQ